MFITIFLQNYQRQFIRHTLSLVRVPSHLLTSWTTSKSELCFYSSRKSSCRWGQYLPHPSTSAPRPTRPPTQWLPGLSREVALTIRLLQPPRLRMDWSYMSPVGASTGMLWEELYHYTVPTMQKTLVFLENNYRIILCKRTPLRAHCNFICWNHFSINFVIFSTETNSSISVFTYVSSPVVTIDCKFHNNFSKC